MVEHTSRRQGIMQRMKIIDERNEMRDMIKELGGEDPLNVIKSYFGQQDPRIIEGRYRDGQPRNQMVEGLTIKGLEPQTMEEKQIIADLLKKYGSMSEISRALEAGEIAIGATAIPALVKAGVKGARKLKDPAVRDMLTPNIFKSSKQGPLTAVGAEVTNKANKKLLELDDYLLKTPGSLASRKNLNYTPKEKLEEIIKLRFLTSETKYYDGLLSNTEIAKEVGVGRAVVDQLFKKLNIKPSSPKYIKVGEGAARGSGGPKRSKVVTVKQYEDIKKLMKDSGNLIDGTEIAKKLNMDRKLVSAALKHMGLSKKTIGEKFEISKKMSPNDPELAKTWSKYKEFFKKDKDSPAGLVRAHAVPEYVYNDTTKFVIPPKGKLLDEFRKYANLTTQSRNRLQVKLDGRLQTANKNFVLSRKKQIKTKFKDKEINESVRYYQNLIKNIGDEFKNARLIGKTYDPFKNKIIEHGMQPESLSKLKNLEAGRLGTSELGTLVGMGKGGRADKPRQGFAPFGGLVESVQNEIKEIAASDTITRIKKPVERKFEEIQQEAKVKLRNERPVRFKTSELFKSAPRELLLKPVGKLTTFPQVATLNAIETAYNALRKGTENDIDMKSRYPSVYKLYDYFNTGIGPTPDEQTYTGFVDETIRSIQKGTQNLGYNALDLAFALPDFAFDTKLQERLKKEYDENAYAKPETFLGNVGSILVEFGVPSGVGFKFVNLLRKGLLGKTGLDLFTTSTYGMKGAQKAKTAISNVAKRVGVVGSSAFLGEFVGGGQYNTVSREFTDDPLFLDQTLGYDYIDTKDMSGKELVIANFTNRLRFGADGAIVAGMFPLVGPVLWKATKYGAIKPSAYVAGKGLQAANILAIKPVSYLLARTPGVAQAGQLTAKGVGLGASFLGKDILSRAAIGFMGTPTLKQLPDFKDWRMFEVTSSDPLESNLKRFDNFLSLFRDTANQSANRFFISGQTNRSIKALSRKVEKQLDSVEQRAYDLAKGFLKDYNTKTVSPAKQEYYLDQVMSYLKGQIKATDLPEVLQEPSQALNKTFIQIKKDFADILPDGAGLKDFLNTNLRQYMRASFKSFTNPFYRPDKQTFDKAVDFMVDRINRNENMVEAAIRASNKPTDVAIKDYARRQVESILERGKFDGVDPLDQLNFIARSNLKMEDLVVQTGEELPEVIRKLLGEEDTLRTSVMTTAADLASQTANSKMYDNLANLGLKEGWLFSSAEEAIAAGIANPKRIGPRLPGLGKLESPISKLHGNREIIESLVNTSGVSNNKFIQGAYQSLIGYKAMVQTGKTVYSPATQTRNFGSAGFFPLQSGHIGGSASVQDAFKITLDDIFGAGRIADEQQLIDRITKKIELGVLDENVVVSELKDILQELKAGGFKTFNALSDRIDQAKLSKTATRLYAGGDNVWKWYGHEFVMSQIKNGFKNVDDLVKEYKQTFRTDINPKTLQEGIEQYAATLIRETYPTYSKVPKLIQFIRKLPVIGNFVSFPAEILRTTFVTSALAAKHIASNNPTLRELGYRTLMGQMITYGGIGAATGMFAKAMTNVTDQQIRDIKEYFAPEFMRYSDLVPMTNVEDGVLKVFDNSRYFPYDLITSTTGNLINRMFTQREKLDPDKIETDMFKDLLAYTGPFADLAGGSLFGVSIGYEPVLDMIRGGRTKTGSAIYSGTDTPGEKFDKMIAHTFETINPGFIRTLQNLYKSFAGLLTATGQPIKPEDEVFKLFGGSTVTIDVPGAFRFKIGELKSSFREPKVSEEFFKPDFRPAAQLVREYNEQNEEAFREQYEFFKVVRAAKRNNFMSDVEMIRLLSDRVGKKTAVNILSGRFTPLSYSKDALKGRFENVKRGNPDETFSLTDFLPFAQLEGAKSKWSLMKFEDFEKEMKEPEQTSAAPVVAPQQTAEAPEPEVAPLPDTPQPTVAPVDMVNRPNTTTGLTDAESVYLGPTEQLYRRRERGIT